jgi:hypothetical protein
MTATTCFLGKKLGKQCLKLPKAGKNQAAVIRLYPVLFQRHSKNFQMNKKAGELT